MAGLLTASAVGLAGVLMFGSIVMYAFVAGHPGQIAVGVERPRGQTTRLVPDCGEAVEPPVQLLVNDLDDPYGSSVPVPSVAGGDLVVQRADDFEGWRLTTSALPPGPVVMRPSETDSDSYWFGILPADAPDGLSVTDLSDDPGGVRVSVVDDLDRLVRVACQYR